MAAEGLHMRTQYSGFSRVCIPLIATMSLLAGEGKVVPEWNEPALPFHIVGDVYFVGTNELGAYVVTSPRGHVMIDGGFKETVPLLLESVKKLGLRVEDIKVLLTTQAHYDHVGSLAGMKAASGAQVMAMEGDAEVLERGGRDDFAFGNEMTFDPVHVDRVLHDGDTVRIGDTVLTARRTAGHTRGATTWTMTTDDDNKLVRVVFPASLTVNPPVRLVKQPSYPGIADDYRHSFEVMRTLSVDVFLSAHTGFCDLEGKRRRMGSRGPNPFIDPDGYRQYLDRLEQAFRERVAKEQ
jgi:metallo-beta-lactamase class B